MLRSQPMPALAEALRDPIALPPNRIPRFYRGGMLLDRFRGIAVPADDDRPEDWVGSATATWTPAGAAPTTLGISRVRVHGHAVSMADLLAAEPEALVGRAWLDRAGPTLGLLVKLLDAGERLPVHCHPSREAAARLLGSPFGKTEAWLILGTRDGATTRVWAGFREPVTPGRLRSWIDVQDTGALLGALAEHEVAPGDVLLIGAGMPHAIGAGTFLLELQEPTDFSIVAETRGFPIDPRDASLGIGWEEAIAFFDTSRVGAVRQQPAPASESVTRLVGPAADPYFRLLWHEVRGEASPPFDPAFAVGVVVSGEGSVRGARQSLPLAAGTTFALAAAGVAGARLESREGMQIAWCLGPDPAALDAHPLPTG